MILTIVVVDVDVVFGGIFEGLLEALGLVVQSSIKAQVLHQPPTLVVAPTHAHHPCTLDLGDLTSHAPRGARGAGNHHGLARLRVGDLGHAPPGRDAGDAEGGEHILRGAQAGEARGGLEVAVADDGVLRPAGGGVNIVARGGEGASGGEDATGSGAAHDAAEGHGLHVGAGLCH